MKLRIFWIACVLCFLISCPIVSAQEPVTLRVSLYREVPDQERFLTAVRNEWSERHPDIPLEFVDWNSYFQDLPEDLDVFEYDAIYFSRFLEEGRLLPLTADEIENREDLFAYALDGAAADGKFFGIPKFLCSDFLYTRKDDTGMAEIDSIPELYQVLGKTDTDKTFPENEGLLINIVGEASADIMYYQALVDAEQTADTSILLPLDPDHLSAEAVDSLTMLREMAGLAQMTWIPEDGNSLSSYRGKAFAEGSGRAYIGTSESMALMGDEAQNMDIRLFSMTDDKNIPLFYIDYASVNANISKDKKELAIELLNVITGTEVMVNALSPAVSGQTYQYLLPARESVFDAIAEKDPVYAQLKDIVINSDIRLFIIPVEFLSPLDKSQTIKALFKE